MGYRQDIKELEATKYTKDLMTREAWLEEEVQKFVELSKIYSEFVAVDKARMY